MALKLIEDPESKIPSITPFTSTAQNFMSWNMSTSKKESNPKSSLNNNLIWK